MTGEELGERIDVSVDVCCEKGEVVALPVGVRVGTWAHDLTVMSVISPLKPPGTCGSLVSQTST